MSEDHLGKFIASKAGQALLQDVHHAAESLRQLALVAEHPLRTLETGGTDPLPAYVEDIAKQHAALLQREGEPLVQEGEKPTWWFPQVSHPYIEAYAFRRADDGFYRFEAILLGESPEAIRSVTIVGDCDNDTYYFGGQNDRLTMAHLLSHSDTPYLLSKGSVRQVFTAERAGEDFTAFCESNAADLEKSVAKLKADLEHHEGDDAADAISDELKPLERDSEAWHDLGGEVSPVIENCAEGLTTMWDILESALDAESRYDRLRESIPERCDCTWGYDYDAMTYARVRQLRWFGLWLERHLTSGGK
jgi:hypothetical protein